MKKLLIITYNLDFAFNYSPFYEKLKTVCEEWRHMMENAWLVYTEKSPNELVNELKPLMSPAHVDSIFICGITNEHEGYIGKSTWEWLGKKEEECACSLNEALQNFGKDENRTETDC